MILLNSTALILIVFEIKILQPKVSLEIQRKITLADKCYCRLSRQLKGKVLSRLTKTVQVLSVRVLLYGTEAWTMSTSDERVLGVFGRKALRKICGPLNIGNGKFRR